MLFDKDYFYRNGQTKVINSVLNIDLYSSSKMYMNVFI